MMFSSPEALQSAYLSRYTRSPLDISKPEGFYSRKVATRGFRALAPLLSSLLQRNQTVPRDEVRLQNPVCLDAANDGGVESLAYAELYLAIATLITQFDFELYETTIEDVEFQHD